ncbi:hypothetical protein GJ744_002498 [Endocarpon pusillum]|uniref:Uncharacterized protein n=1 Tax=Endocarpon pusillum TaxID=364733 RepID=A0A8H7DYT6_9EURO|nr:hypothetical protein GJ744_002498 [Endocarpon pusillum]
MPVNATAAYVVGTKHDCTTVDFVTGLYSCGDGTVHAPVLKSSFRIIVPLPSPLLLLGKTVIRAPKENDQYPDLDASTPR